MASNHPVTKPSVRAVPTDRLTDGELVALHGLVAAAFRDDGFSEQDWRHALGGVHLLLELGPEIFAHAAVVERELHVAGRPLRTGYVEAVATAPARQRRGHGSMLLRAVTRHIRDRFELGALSTGSPAFYERLGWQRWRGPTFARTPAGAVRTADEDDGILVLLTPRTPPIDLTAPISCDWRPGDVW